MHFIIRSFWLKALGLSLAGSLWQMALVWFIYLLISARGNRIKAEVKHTLATLGIAGGTAWFIFSLVSNLASGEALFAGPSWLSLSLSSNMGLSHNLFSIKNYINEILPFLSFAYLITLAILISRYIRFFRHSSLLRNFGLNKMKPELRLFVTSVARRLGIKKEVAVWLSSVVESPMTLGFLKPIILIPIATVNHLSVQQVETILLHELAHIRRNDYLLNLFLSVTGILFFFNPFSRLLIHAIKKERENCCDDLVIQFRYDPASYASALLSLEKTRNTHQLAMAAIGKSKQLLLERVRRVTGQKNPFFYFHPRLVASILLSLFLGFIILFQAQISKSIYPEKTGLGAGTELAYRFSTKPIPVFLKLEKKKKAVKKKEKDLIAVTLAAESEFTLVSSEGDNGDQTVTQASDVQPEDQALSITQAAASPTTPPDVPEGNFPFVPSYSFSYQIVDEGVKPQVANGEVTAKAETLAERESDLILEPIRKSSAGKLGGQGKKARERTFRWTELKSLPIPETGKTSEGESCNLSEADQTRIKGDIHLQLQAINRCLLKKDTETLQLLQNQVSQEKLKLQQDWLKKQKQMILNIEEFRKKNKIVYI
jgi:beta-lactamase regulating signal transducer with metallopeptidase domain